MAGINVTGGGNGVAQDIANAQAAVQAQLMAFQELQNSLKSMSQMMQQQRQFDSSQAESRRQFEKLYDRQVFEFKKNFALAGERLQFDKESFERTETRLDSTLALNQDIFDETVRQNNLAGMTDALLSIYPNLREAARDSSGAAMMKQLYGVQGIPEAIAEGFIQGAANYVTPEDFGYADAKRYLGDPGFAEGYLREQLQKQQEFESVTATAQEFQSEVPSPTGASTPTTSTPGGSTLTPSSPGKPVGFSEVSPDTRQESTSGANWNWDAIYAEDPQLVEDTAKGVYNIDPNTRSTSGDVVGLQARRQRDAAAFLETRTQQMQSISVMNPITQPMDKDGVPANPSIEKFSGRTTDAAYQAFKYIDDSAGGLPYARRDGSRSATASPEAEQLYSRIQRVIEKLNPEMEGSSIATTSKELRIPRTMDQLIRYEAALGVTGTTSSLMVNGVPINSGEIVSERGQTLAQAENTYRTQTQSTPREARATGFYVLTSEAAKQLSGLTGADVAAGRYTAEQWKTFEDQMLKNAGVTSGELSMRATASRQEGSQSYNTVMSQERYLARIKAGVYQRGGDPFALLKQEGMNDVEKQIAEAARQFDFTQEESQRVLADQLAIAEMAAKSEAQGQSIKTNLEVVLKGLELTEGDAVEFFKSDIFKSAWNSLQYLDSLRLGAPTSTGSVEWRNWFLGKRQTVEYLVSGLNAVGIFAESAQQILGERQEDLAKQSTTATDLINEFGSKQE